MRFLWSLGFGIWSLGASTSLQRSSRRKEAQISRLLRASKVKSQSLLTSAATREFRVLTPGLGVWNLRFLWSLELGIWSFFSAMTVSAAESSAPVPTNEASIDLISTLFVFMLATFVGLEVIRRVSRLLHTPLMSLTNAISAIAVVGAILVAGPDHPGVIHWLGLVAVVASVTNIVSGFLITDRMLKMFKKKTETKPK